MNSLQKQQIRCDETDKRSGLLSKPSLIEYEKLYAIHKLQIIEQREEFAKFTVQKFTELIKANSKIKPDLLKIIISLGESALPSEKQTWRKVYTTVKSLP
jgi:hypothetical protein